MYAGLSSWNYKCKVNHWCTLAELFSDSTNAAAAVAQAAIQQAQAVKHYQKQVSSYL